MKNLNIRLEKAINYNPLLWVFLLFICLYSFYGSINQGSYIYDGFHWGLVASNANDFLNGKLPYKDFFVHYGFVTLLIQSIIYKIFSSIYSLIVLAAITYIISIIIVFSIIKKFTSNNYCYLFLSIVFFFQPHVFYPWHTYFIFLFSTTGIAFYLRKNYLSYFSFGLCIQLAYLSSESFKVCSYLTVFSAILILYFEKKII